jgi:putative hemolysin
MLIRIDRGIDVNRSADLTAGRRFYVRLARSWSEVEAAQRLRWRVFSDEMGARLESGRPGIDWDVFDDHCDHLLAFEAEEGRVIGTYRILTPEGAARLGACYSEREFDLSPLQVLRPQAAEIGRSCVDPAWRGSAVLALMWSALIDYARERGLSYLMGCASVPMTDGGVYAANLYNTMRPNMVEPALRVQPRVGLDVHRLATGEPARTPTLIRGYLRIGARICGLPAVDTDFNTADFLMLLDIESISTRFARRFEAAARTGAAEALAA